VVYPVLALEILAWGLFAIAVDLLLGFGGLLSFGHAAYWGVAGYVAGIVARDAGAPYPVAALAGLVAAAVLAVPLGYLSPPRPATSSSPSCCRRRSRALPAPSTPSASASPRSSCCTGAPPARWSS